MNQEGSRLEAVASSVRLGSERQQKGSCSGGRPYIEGTIHSAKQRVFQERNLENDPGHSTSIKTSY